MSECEGDVDSPQVSSDDTLSMEEILAALFKQLSAKIDSAFPQQPENTLSFVGEDDRTQPEVKAAQSSVDEAFLKKFRETCEELERNPRPKEAPCGFVDRYHIDRTVAEISVLARGKVGPDLQAACGEIYNYNLSIGTRSCLADLVGVILKPNRSSAYRQEMIVTRKTELLRDAVGSFLYRQNSDTLEEKLDKMCEKIDEMSDTLRRASLQLSRTYSSLEDIHNFLQERRPSAFFFGQSRMPTRTPVIVGNDSRKLHAHYFRVAEWPYRRGP